MRKYITSMYAGSISYPLISISLDLGTINMVTTYLCFTQFVIGHLKEDSSCLYVKYWDVTYFLRNFTSIYHSIWRPPTSLSTCCHLNFPMLMCNLTKIHTQKCGNFEKTMSMTSSHVQCLCFRTCLSNVTASIKCDFGHDPHWSADLTQRSRLFIWVETNSW